jgi:phage repressor protein C with HTH and peptisase S24 domain
MPIDKSEVQREQQALLKRVITATGKTSTELAREISVAPSTLNRFLNNADYKGTLSATTVAKLKAIEDSIRGKSFPFQAVRTRDTVELPKGLDPSAEIIQLHPGAGRTTRIPVLGIAVGGEDGMFELNGVVHEVVDGPASLSGVDGAYAVYMRGDSMEPKYEHGQTLFVHPYRPVRPGNYVVVQLSDSRAMVKRYLRRTAHEIVIEQLNPRREIALPSDSVASVHLIVVANELT